MVKAWARPAEVRSGPESLPGGGRLEGPTLWLYVRSSWWWRQWAVSPLPVEGMDDLDCSSSARIATQGNCSCLLRRLHVPVEKGRQLEHPLSGVISLMSPFWSGGNNMGMVGKGPAVRADVESDSNRC
jgi:hypothetical protein